MKKYFIILSLCFVFMLLTLKANAQEPDDKTALARRSEIITNIYNDICRIQDKYADLKGFDKEAEKEPDMIYFNREPGIFLQIMLLESAFDSGMFETKPQKEIFIKGLGMYLSCRIWDADKELETEILQIVDKNADLAKQSN